MRHSDLDNTKESILPVCDKLLHNIKENLPHWEELENICDTVHYDVSGQSITNFKITLLTKLTKSRVGAAWQICPLMFS